MANQQEKFFETATEQMTRQVDQMMSLVNFWQSQTQKAVDLWLDQSANAVRESQKLVKEWVSTGNQASADLCKAFETNLKEAVKLFTPEMTKAGKA
ncbi:MAG: hypothetical protein Kow0092_35610 [Deferrisomatales bacterium]